MNEINPGLVHGYSPENMPRSPITSVKRAAFGVERTAYQFLHMKPPRRSLRIKPSVEIRLNAIATGILYEERKIDKIVTTGTAVGGIGTEAEGQYSAGLIHSTFPEIPSDNLIVEDQSKTTGQNLVNGVARMREAGWEFDSFDSVTIGFHRRTVAHEAKVTGVPLRRIYASEKVVSRKSAKHAEIVNRYKRSRKYIYGFIITNGLYFIRETTAGRAFLEKLANHARKR